LVEKCIGIIYPC